MRKLFALGLLGVSVCLASCTGKTTKSSTSQHSVTPSGGYASKGGSAVTTNTSGRSSADIDVMGVAVDKSGNVYAVNPDKKTVQKFDPSGKYLTEWKMQTKKEHFFGSSLPFAVDGKGGIYFSDGEMMDSGIEKYDASGKFLGKQAVDSAADMTIDEKGTIYVLKQFAQGGSPIMKIDPTAWGTSDFGLAEGSGGGTSPKYIAVDGKGFVYTAGWDGSWSNFNGSISGNWNVRVQKIGPDGKVLADLKGTNKTHPDLAPMEDMAVTKDGRLLCLSGASIREYDMSGKLLRSWGKEGENPGELSRPNCLTTDSTGNVYIGCDDGRVIKYDPSGKFLTQYQLK